MALGWQQLLIILVLVLILFGGRGRISSVMGDMAKGLRSFRKGLAESDDEADAGQTASLDTKSAETVEPTTASAEEVKKAE
ncbi:MAG: twin-arginine translocase TatA/TatE family subunit [Pseudomonadota bacterium]